MRLVFFSLFAINLVLLGFWLSTESQSTLQANVTDETKQAIVLVNNLTEAEIRTYDTEYQLAKRFAKNTVKQESPQVPLSEQRVQQGDTEEALTQGVSEHVATPIVSESDVSTPEVVVTSKEPSAVLEDIEPINSQDSIEIIKMVNNASNQAVPSNKPIEVATLTTQKGSKETTDNKSNVASVDVPLVITDVANADNADISSACYRLDGIQSRDDANGIKQQLGSVSENIQIAASTVERIKAYKIVIPALDTYQQAQALSKTLNAVGIETYIPNKGELKNAILAGYFSSDANANKRLNQLKEMSITAQSIPVTQSTKGYKLLITSSFSIQKLNDLLEKDTGYKEFSKKIEKVEINACQAK